LAANIARHASIVRAAIETSEAAKSAIVASWRRSAVQHNLDPANLQLPTRLSEAEFAAARQQMEPLIRAAQASLDRLYLAVCGTGCCVLLADDNGISVERRGAAVDDDVFESWGLWTGSVWREDMEGTNGIGTCLAVDRAITIDRDQHYLSRNINLSCAAAPIYDCCGDIAGVLNVSSCRADLTDRFLNLISMAVSDAAQRIEADNFRLSFSKERILIVPTSNRTSAALLAVDRDDVVVGATRLARAVLGITGKVFESSPSLMSLIGRDLHQSNDLKGAERAVLERALACSEGNVTAAARSLGISRATLHRKICRHSLKIRRRAL